MQLSSIKELKNLKNKTILIRTDFNVPFDKNGNISDDSRIKKSLKTINFLRKKKARIVLITHIGRPEKKEASLSTKNIKKRIESLVKTKIFFIDDCIGKKVELKKKSLKEGEILLLENIRFYKEEENNDNEFAIKLAKNVDLYVNEAFSASHRKHASTYQIAKYLKAYAGFQVLKEIEGLSKAFESQKALTLIIGGAKIDTKIALIKNFKNKAENIIIGGAMANTFLKAQGFETGKSLIEKDKINYAKNIIKTFKNSKTKLILAIDFRTSLEIKENSKTKNKLQNEIEKNEIIIDIGEKSEKLFNKIISKSQKIIFNGPMGIYEIKNFAKGTKSVLESIKKNKKAFKIIGGGDSVDALKKFRISEKHFNHVSTGGGASIEFLEGKMLPGIEVLLKKQ